jgi:tetratricopeptide (TPR) repeat protein
VLKLLNRRHRYRFVACFRLRKVLKTKGGVKSVVVRKHGIDQLVLESIEENVCPVATCLSTVDLCFRRDTASAKGLFRDAIDCKAHCPFAHSVGAFLYLALGRPQDSLEALQSAWNHDAISAPLTALLSNGHYYGREFDKAVQEGLKAVESEPTFPVAHACLGQALTQIGRFEEAIQHLELARDLRVFIVIMFASLF